MTINYSIRGYHLNVAKFLYLYEHWRATKVEATMSELKLMVDWCNEQFGAIYNPNLFVGSWFGVDLDEGTGPLTRQTYFLFQREADLTVFLLRWSR
jgi:hypothetical protein